MRIGLDFDNTLVCYDQAFYTVAVQLGLLPPDFIRQTKQAVKTFLQTQGERGEQIWQALQGQVYGRFIKQACLFKGVRAFLRKCQEEQHTIWIVSHKTQYGHFDETRTDLRSAARNFMEDQGFFSEYGLNPAQIQFCATRDEKIKTIDDLKLDCFVDDLFDVLTHPAFPKGVKPYWFVPDPCVQHVEQAQKNTLFLISSWDMLLKDSFCFSSFV